MLLINSPPLSDADRVAVTTSEGTPCASHGTGETRGEGSVSVRPPRSELGTVSRLTSGSRKARTELAEEDGLSLPEELLREGVTLELPRLMARW